MDRHRETLVIVVEAEFMPEENVLPTLLQAVRDAVDDEVLGVRQLHVAIREDAERVLRVFSENRRYSHDDEPPRPPDPGADYLCHECKKQPGTDVPHRAWCSRV